LRTPPALLTSSEFWANVGVQALKASVAAAAARLDAGIRRGIRADIWQMTRAEIRALRNSRSSEEWTIDFIRAAP
jgi:hypothetical protein